MRQIIFTAILVFASCFAGFAQGENLYPPNIDPPRFGKLSWEHEKALLDGFSRLLSAEKDSEGLIELQFDKKSHRSERIKRLIRISKFIDLYRLVKKRTLFRISEGDFVETTYWIITKNNFKWLKVEDENHKVIKADELKQKIKELFPKK